AYRHERRFLPSLPEYLWLAYGVPRGKRKPAEQALMGTAARYHGLRWGTALCVLLLLGFVLQQFLSSVYRKARQERAETLVNVVANAAPQGVPAAIEHLKPMGDICLPILRERFQEAPDDSSQRLHLAFALASFGEVEEGFLLQRMATLPVSEAGNMMATLDSGKAVLAPKLLQGVEGE